MSAFCICLKVTATNGGVGDTYGALGTVGPRDRNSLASRATSYMVTESSTISRKTDWQKSPFILEGTKGRRRRRLLKNG